MLRISAWPAQTQTHGRICGRILVHLEDLLPIPNKLETAKSCREERSKLLLERIIKTVHSVYLACLDVRQKIELLQRKYDTEVPYLTRNV